MLCLGCLGPLEGAGGWGGQLRLTGVQHKCQHLRGSMAVGLGWRRVLEPQAQVRHSTHLDLALLELLGELRVQPLRSLEGKLWPSVASHSHSPKEASAFPATPSAGGATAPSSDGWVQRWQWPRVSLKSSQWGPMLYWQIKRTQKQITWHLNLSVAHLWSFPWR